MLVHSWLPQHNPLCIMFDRRPGTNPVVVVQGLDTIDVGLECDALYIHTQRLYIEKVGCGNQVLVHKHILSLRSYQSSLSTVVP